MPQTTAIVCHSICDARNMMQFRFVSKMALVKGGDLKQVCGRASSGGASFCAPCDSKCVVRQIACREMRDRHS